MIDIAICIALVGDIVRFTMNGGLLIHAAARTLNRSDTEDSQSGVTTLRQDSVGENGPFRLRPRCRRHTLVNIPSKAILDVIDVYLHTFKQHKHSC